MLNKNDLVTDVFANITPTKQSQYMLRDMKRAYTNFGSLFRKISEITNVPESIIFCFAMVEDGTNMAMGKTAGYINDKTGQIRRFIGIMQFGYSYADDTLINNIPTYNQKERLFIGDNFGLVGDAIAKDDKEKIDVYKKIIRTPSKNLFTRQELAKSPANVFIGTQMLITFLNKPYAMVGNDVLMERVIVAYNSGPGAVITTGASKQTAKEILNNPKISPESKNYIRDFLGNGGYLDLWNIHFEK